MTKYDIYLIWGKDQDGNILRYYGSTANFIKRKSQHKRNYERWVKAGRPNNKIKCSSVYILDNGDWKMEKIDEIIGDRWEAKKKEGEYQKNNDCVNVCIASRTKKEWNEDNKEKMAEWHKQYRADNKDKFIEYLKQYYNDNKQAILEKQKENNKEYYEKNKQAILEKKQEYYNDNKQTLLEKMKEKITCECGAEISKIYIYKHRKTKKHINLLSNNELNV